MPQPGSHSLTLQDATYNYIRDIYIEHKDALKINGVTTFSAFCAMMLTRGVHNWVPPANPSKKNS